MWRDDDRKLAKEREVEVPGGCKEEAQGFKWRRAMEKVDGEYIVI